MVYNLQMTCVSLADTLMLTIWLTMRHRRARVHGSHRSTTSNPPKLLDISTRNHLQSGYRLVQILVVTRLHQSGLSKPVRSSLSAGWKRVRQNACRRLPYQSQHLLEAPTRPLPDKCLGHAMHIHRAIYADWKTTQHKFVFLLLLLHLLLHYTVSGRLSLHSWTNSWVKIFLAISTSGRASYGCIKGPIKIASTFASLLSTPIWPGRHSSPLAVRMLPTRELR